MLGLHCLNERKERPWSFIFEGECAESQLDLIRILLCMISVRSNSPS